MTRLPFFSDDEIRELCVPLVQPGAQLRYLRGLGLLAQVKLNGKPLLAVSEFERVLGAGRFSAAPAGNGPYWTKGPDVEALQRHLANRKRKPAADKP